MRISTLFCAALLGLGSAGAAAHPAVEEASPFPESTVAKAPRQIRLTFNERILLPYSGITVTGPGGRKLRMGAPVKVADQRQLVVPIAAAMQPGSYVVEWHVVSADTHRVEGSYGFVVARR